MHGSNVGLFWFDREYKAPKYPNAIRVSIYDEALLRLGVDTWMIS